MPSVRRARTQAVDQVDAGHALRQAAAEEGRAPRPVAARRRPPEGRVVGEDLQPGLAPHADEHRTFRVLTQPRRPAASASKTTSTRLLERQRVERGVEDLDAIHSLTVSRRSQSASTKNFVAQLGNDSGAYAPQTGCDPLIAPRMARSLVSRSCVAMT